MAGESKQNFQVRVWFDDRDDGKTFGPVNGNHKAIILLQVLAARPDVLKAQIEEIE